MQTKRSHTCLLFEVINKLRVEKIKCPIQPPPLGNPYLQ